MRRDFAYAVAATREERGAAAALATALAAVWDLVLTAFLEYAHMLVRDLRFALRSLRRTPLFTAVIVATLAIAIGANAAVFSILDAVVLAPLPYAQPDRLVALNWTDHGEDVPASLPDIADAMTDAHRTIVQWAAFSPSAATVTGIGSPRRIDEIVTTPQLFTVLGIRPLLGGFPSPADARPGAARVAVVSEGFWRSALHAAPGAVGSLVRVDGMAFRVIGVAPDMMRQPSTKRFGAGFKPADLWTFVSNDGRGTRYDRGNHGFDSIARLTNGASLAAANASLARATTDLHRRNPVADANVGLSAESLADSMLGDDRTLFFAIFAGVAAVLLVACANVANLLLSRAASREREISVRTAVGASRGRIVMQLLVEAFVLAALGGALGVALADVLVRAFINLHPDSIPRANDVTIGVPTLLFTLGVVVLATIAAGLAPAITASKLDIATALKSAGRGGDGHRGARARDAFVASEVAITFALVVVAGLVLRSFVALTAQPLGFDSAGVYVAADVDLTGHAYATDADRETFERRALASIRAVPGVRSAAWTNYAPFMGRDASSLTIVGRAYAPGTNPNVDVTLIGSDYFRALHGELVAGRSFSDDDRAGTQPVAIVNDRFAREYFPGRSALGAKINVGFARLRGPSPARTIVGIVHDLRGSLVERAAAGIYEPLAQVQNDYGTLLVDTAPGIDVGPAIASAIVAADPLLPRPAVVSLASQIGATVAGQRLELVALSVLAGIALVLAAAGIFAVISFGVTQRTHEFGIRLALGSAASGILAIVIAGALRLVAVGVVAGLLLAAISTRFLGAELYETAPLDPATFAIVTAIVVLVAIVAALVPGLRATRVDPIVALRYE